MSVHLHLYGGLFLLVVFRLHAVGILGGIIWGYWQSVQFCWLRKKAGAAISYGLGQGATMVAAFWGVFIWKEFVGGPKINRTLLTCMFILFLSGIGLIIYAGLLNGNLYI